MYTSYIVVFQNFHANFFDEITSFTISPVCVGAWITGKRRRGMAEEEERGAADRRAAG